MRRRDAFLLTILWAGVACGQATLPPQVKDNIYGASWDGVKYFAPSQNSVYDQVEAIIAGALSAMLLDVQNKDPNGGAMLYWPASGDCDDLPTTAYGRGLVNVGDANDLRPYAKLPAIVATDHPYHADNTGKTVTTAALHAAIDAAELTGRELVLPNGIYRTAQLPIEKGITIRGENRFLPDTSSFDFRNGVTLAYDGPGTESIIRVRGGPIYGLEIDGIVLTEWRAGMTTGAVAAAEQTKDVNGISLEATAAGAAGIFDTSIRRVGAYGLKRGVSFYGGDGTDHNTEYVNVTESVFHHCQRAAEINTRGSYHISFGMCRFYAGRWGEYGIKVTRGGVHVTNRCFFYGGILYYSAGDDLYNGDIWVDNGFAHVSDSRSESDWGSFFRLVDSYPTTHHSTLTNCEHVPGDHARTITAFTDLGGGEVQVDCSVTTLFRTGDIVSITGTTNYNGSYSLTVVDADSFKITATFVADDAAGAANVQHSLLVSGNGLLQSSGCTLIEHCTLADPDARWSDAGSYLEKGISMLTSGTGGYTQYMSFFGSRTGYGGQKYLNVPILAAAPSAQMAKSDFYADDGTNTANGRPGWRYYDGAAWKDLTAVEPYFTVTLADDGDWASEAVPVWQAPRDRSITITRVEAAVIGATTPTLTYNIEERQGGDIGSGTGVDIYATDQVADQNGEIETSFNNASIAARAYLVFTTGATPESGTVGSITFTVYYK